MTTTVLEGQARARARGAITLDDLAKASVGELTRMYREARAPESLDGLHGTPRGRMLAVVGPLGKRPMRDVVAAVARAPLFPWIGKRFEAFDARSGQGINRVRVLGERYRFELRYDDSVLDGQRCVLLDYDLPDNPFFIRPIRDELREVSPGLFLGPALLRTRTEPKLVLFFAVEAR